MKIVIDVDSMGHTHFIDTDPTHVPLTQHPDGSGTLITTLQLLAHHNANPAHRTIGGWDVVNQLPGEAAPMSRWQRVVAAANAANADAAVKALNLK